ncbi:hypothetical protein Droror1_Dr00006501 [Drosera rotundifolia]
MASTSIAAQLQAIKSLVGADTTEKLHSTKRPFTRPSILFDPRKAADIDLETIHSFAIAGLEELEKLDKRFRRFKDDLFSLKSVELDRELLNAEVNNRIDASISSYLRLLSGYFVLESALKMVEYLIRRYKVHVYNVDELILSALPYHDTVEFVRVVQLINLGNSRWRFLDGVKSSGAPPPRQVIVCQCIRDLGLLEVLCTHATPAKKFKPSAPMVTFCTAIVVEVLGYAETVDSNVVKRVIPFLFAGFQPEGKSFTDHKAGALMIAVLLANRVALAPKLVKSLVVSIAELSFVSAEESGVSQHSVVSIMALVILVQLQSVETLPKKVVDVLNRIHELPGILSSLIKGFNIDKFLGLLLESLVDYRYYNLCTHQLITIVETGHVTHLVPRVVSRILSSCLRQSEKSNDSDTLESGDSARQLLECLNKKYPDEFWSAFHNFLQDKKVQTKGESLVLESLSRMLDRSMSVSSEVSDSRLWFVLEHPKAEVRRAMLYSLDMCMILRSKALNPQRFAVMENAILRRLSEDDLRVVQAALSLDKLPKLISSTRLLEKLEKIFQTCTGILFSDAPSDLNLASDTTISCLKNAVLVAQNTNELSVKKVANMFFPLLLVRPKTIKLNLKAQEMAKDIDWTFYKSLPCPVGLENKQKPGWITEINMSIVRHMAEVFSAGSEQCMPLLEDCAGHSTRTAQGTQHGLGQERTKCTGQSDFSKTLVFFILLQSFEHHNVGWLSAYEFVKKEWQVTKSVTAVLLSRTEQFNGKLDDEGCLDLLDQVLHTHPKELNSRILVHLLWRLLKAHVIISPENVSSMENDKWMSTLQDLYVFFAQFNEKNVFKEHLAYLLRHCRISPIFFLSQFITQEGFSAAVQVESLHLLAAVCSSSGESVAHKVLDGFPSVLVPLSSDIQAVRSAAMNYVEELLTLCSHIQSKGRKNGNTGSWSPYINELLRILVRQKTLIISGREFLSSLLTSILSSSSGTLLLSTGVHRRFEKSTRKKIWSFLWLSEPELSTYAKLRILTLVKEVGADFMDFKDKSPLSELLKQRSRFIHPLDGESQQKLSNVEVDLLCLLLEICCTSVSANMVDLGNHLLEALRMGNMPSDDAMIMKPCLAVLHHLNTSLFQSLTSETQGQLLEELLLLNHSDNAYIKIAVGEAMLRINIGCSTIGAILDGIGILSSETSFGRFSKKYKKLMHNKPDISFRRTSTLAFLSSLLDVLMLKKDLQNRSSLIKHLFQLLGKIFSSGQPDGTVEDELTQSLGSVSSSLSYIQQTVLLVLEDIFTTLPDDLALNDSILDEPDVAILVECARTATDITTRNHAFSLFTALSKIAPQKILDRAPDMITAIAESSMSENDNHSRRVFEDFIAAVIPCWLSSMNDSLRLLQIFVDLMPDVAQHRRLTITLHLLRTIGESSCFGSLLFLLFRSLVLRKRSQVTSDAHDSNFVNSESGAEWEYVLAVQICEQYSSEIWLPSLVVLLQHLKSEDYDRGPFIELHLAMIFILEKLQDPEFNFRLDSKDTEFLQGALVDLLEQAIFCLTCIESRGKKSNLPVSTMKEHIHSVLKCTTKGMTPSTFFRGVIRLLRHDDKSTRKKVLQLLCETVKSSIVTEHKGNRQFDKSPSPSWQHLQGDALDSFVTLCSMLLPFLDTSCGDASLQLTSALALEVLTNRFRSDHTIFVTCLQVVTKSILSEDLKVASACLRSAGALVNVLGPRALPELPQIMEHILRRSQLVPSVVEENSGKNNGGSTICTLNESIMMSILFILEALIVKLGAFLNPYLQNVLELMVLQPDYTSESSRKLKSKADDIRRLLSQKISARLLLTPVEKVVPKAVMFGDSSVSIAFHMVSLIVGEMDRTSVSHYHVKLFDFFLLALDLRRQRVPSIKKLDQVEKHVLDAVIALTMKLTETMFKPLFIRSIEWAEANAKKQEPVAGAYLDTLISFYVLVHKLAESHRSLFVPYFKYLRDGCVQHLTDNDECIVDSRRKKKAKLQNSDSKKGEQIDDVLLRRWHLRTLVLSSLHKCFLYDTGSRKFLDSSNFQVLLKPIVSQISVEPPASLEDCPGVPSMKEVDDLLVSCIGQMAVTAGSDLLWKSLNYEVLMQTRNELVRSRILGLRIIKHLVENLKEEYLVLLAETIPFLVELLEDVELSVKTLAQDILRELELMSGEDLKQYF